MAQLCPYHGFHHGFVFEFDADMTDGDYPKMSFQALTKLTSLQSLSARFDGAIEAYDRAYDLAARVPLTRQKQAWGQLGLSYHAPKRCGRHIINFQWACIHCGRATEAMFADDDDTPEKVMAVLQPYLAQSVNIAAGPPPPPPLPSAPQPPQPVRQAPPPQPPPRPPPETAAADAEAEAVTKWWEQAKDIYPCYWNRMRNQKLARWAAASQAAAERTQSTISSISSTTWTEGSPWVIISEGSSSEQESSSWRWHGWNSGRWDRHNDGWHAWNSGRWDRDCGWLGDGTAGTGIPIAAGADGTADGWRSSDDWDHHDGGWHESGWNRRRWDRHGAWRGKGAAAEGTAGTETDMFDIGRTYGTAANPAIIMEDAAAAETSEWE